MKKFSGHKSSKVIKAQCKALGLHFSDILYKQGSDYVTITSIGGDNYSGQVLFNTANGSFFGTAPERAPWNGVSFDSNETTHEREEWFQQLLAFFYYNDDAKSATT